MDAPGRHPATLVAAFVDRYQLDHAPFPAPDRVRAAWVLIHGADRRLHRLGDTASTCDVAGQGVPAGHDYELESRRPRRHSDRSDVRR